MKQMFKSLNVKSENELNALVESLDLSYNQYVELMSLICENENANDLREQVIQLSETFGNDADIKLKKHLNRKVGHRELKEDTVYDHSWYEVKGQKYPKRTKEGVICEGKEDNIDVEDEMEEEDDVEIKVSSNTDPEITQFISTSTDVVSNTTNPKILKGILNSIETKLPLAVDTEQINELSELKQKVETKLAAVNNIKDIHESKSFTKTLLEDEEDEEDNYDPEDDLDNWDDWTDEQRAHYVLRYIKPEVRKVDTDDYDNTRLGLLIGDANSDFQSWIFYTLEDGSGTFEWDDNYIFHRNDSWKRLVLDNPVFYDNLTAYLYDYLEKHNLVKVDEEGNEVLNAYFGEPTEEGDEFDEAFDPTPADDDPIFDIGDEVEFQWGNDTVTGRIIGTTNLKGNVYYNVISWNVDKERNENYTRIDPISNEMKKIVKEEL